MKELSLIVRFQTYRLDKVILRYTGQMRGITVTLEENTQVENLSINSALEMTD